MGVNLPAATRSEVRGGHPGENVKLDEHYRIGSFCLTFGQSEHLQERQGTGVRPGVTEPVDSALTVVLRLARERLGIK